MGERFLVQTDYRWLPTASSNAAFGYNFEGALQEYVLMDERVITSPEGESMLIPVPEDLPASALALVEPWACVENSYAEVQRKTLKDRGHALVVGETPVDEGCIANLPGKPGATTFKTADKVSYLADAAYDDVIYFGSNPETVEKLFSKVAAGGLFNIVQSGGSFAGRLSRRLAACITAASVSSVRPDRIPRRRWRPFPPRRKFAPRTKSIHRGGRTDGNDARHSRSLSRCARREGVCR